MPVFTGPIKDVCLGIYDGPHATPAEADEGPVFLGIKNVTEDGRLDFTETKRLSEQDFERWTRRVTPQAGDIVFSYEATLHRYALIPDGFRGCLGRRMALVRVDPERVDSQFLRAYFLSASWRAQVERNVINGATVDRIPLTRFPEFEITLPDLETQRRTAAVITAYEALIANNRRRIRLLEQAARLLYREWFVYLRFPGHEHTRMVDGVPDGWSRKTVGEVAPEVKSACDPKRLDPETPYIGLEHIPRRSITLGEWGTAAEVESGKTRFQEGDILFGKIRPYFHKVGFTLRDGITSSDSVVLRPSSEAVRAFALLTLSSDEFVALASKTVREGSKMPRADWKYLSGRTVPFPPASLLDSFNAIAGPITAQLKTLALANRQLAQTRNLLLPRLMSGEIEV